MGCQVTAIENTAAWRSVVASEHPDDKRNEKAVAGLTRLAETVSDVSAGQAEAYDALWENDGIKASEIQSEMLRSVGFSRTWGTAEEFVADLIERAAR